MGEWHPFEEHPVDPRLDYLIPEGMVAISPAVEEDGRLIQYFGPPGSGGWMDGGTLDLGIVRDDANSEGSFSALKWIGDRLADAFNKLGVSERFTP